MNKIPNKKLRNLTLNIAVVVFAVIIGLPLGNILMKQITTPLSSSAPIPMKVENANAVFQSVSEELIIFGDTKCEYCKEGVQFLDKLGVKYKIYYIDRDEQAKNLYKHLEASGVPVLVSRSQYYIGFNKKVWQEFLGAVPS